MGSLSGLLTGALLRRSAPSGAAALAPGAVPPVKPVASAVTVGSNLSPSDNSQYLLLPASHRSRDGHAAEVMLIINPVPLAAEAQQTGKFTRALIGTPSPRA